MKNYIVFDIGGTAIKWSVINEEGNILLSEKIKTPTIEQDFLYVLIHCIHTVKSKYDIEGIAISAPGAIDNRTGLVCSKSAIPYLEGLDIKKILSEVTGLHVSIENDANCAALGETWMGAGKDYNDLAFVVCGSGIGGAIIKDKKVHQGSNKHGGEFGYMILSYDLENEFSHKTWSNIGSTIALVREVAKRKKLKESDLDGVTVFEMAEDGDITAKEEINKFYFNMAVGIYNIQHMYDPEIILIGGGISEREEFIHEINKRLDIIIDRENTKVRPNIKACEKGNDANKLGALYNYLQEYKIIKS